MIPASSASPAAFDVSLARSFSHLNQFRTTFPRACPHSLCSPSCPVIDSSLAGTHFLSSDFHPTCASGGACKWQGQFVWLQGLVGSEEGETLGNAAPPRASTSRVSSNPSAPEDLSQSVVIKAIGASENFPDSEQKKLIDFSPILAVKRSSPAKQENSSAKKSRLAGIPTGMQAIVRPAQPTTAASLEKKSTPERKPKSPAPANSNKKISKIENSQDLPTLSPEILQLIKPVLRATRTPLLKHLTAVNSALLELNSLGEISAFLLAISQLGRERIDKIATT